MFRMRVLSHEIRTALEPYHEVVTGLLSKQKSVRFYNTDTHSIIRRPGATSPSASRSHQCLQGLWARCCHPRGFTSSAQHINIKSHMTHITIRTITSKPVPFTCRHQHSHHRNHPAHFRYCTMNSHCKRKKYSGIRFSFAVMQINRRTVLFEHRFASFSY